MTGPPSSEPLAEHFYREAARLAPASPLRRAVDLAALAAMGPAERDQLRVGLVQLDDDGFVLACNGALARACGLATAEPVGQHYFSELEPCTNNALFRGSFERGLAEGALDHGFQYTFTVGRPPTHACVHLYRDPDSATNWVLIEPL